jgi:phenylpyruvate tautomerase PptA (4-oxalocrotonate tautomerase family)
MPKLEIENPTEEDKQRIAKWVAEIVANVYLKGLKDGMNDK